MKLGKKDKGQAGLTVLLSVVTFLFVIGLLVMIFSMMGAELSDEIDTRSSNLSIDNETLAGVDSDGELLSVSTYDNVICAISEITINTTVTIPTANYTQTNCLIANATGANGDLDWNVTYSYTYNIPSEASSVIDNTTSSLAGVTSWFPIIIVISAMVVLILLTVIIITAIRGSGLIGGGQGGQGGQSGGNRNVGNA